eukprot:scaffold2214_cov128-Isochrysis_galbana.AAC.6
MPVGALCHIAIMAHSVRPNLRETAPCPTSDDVGHVHASLDRGRRPRRHAKCAISDTHVLRQGMAGRMQPAAALWSRIAARGGGQSAPLDASGDVPAERKLTAETGRAIGRIGARLGISWSSYPDNGVNGH